MKRTLLAGTFAFLGLFGVAHAEVGNSSARPGEWFLGLDVGGGAAWGPVRQASIKSVPGGLDDIDIEDGAFYFGGLELGYVLADPQSWLERVELDVEFRELSRDLNRNPSNSTLYIRDDNSSTSIGVGGDTVYVDSEDDEQNIEARLSFKGRLLDGEDHVLFGSIEPFYRYQDLDGVDRNGFAPSPIDNGIRYNDIEANYFGLQLAVEGERPLTETLHLIGRASAGAYYVDADIDSHMTLMGDDFGQPISDSNSTWGGRFGAQAGVKIPLGYAGASISVLATVDYMTDVATIDHVRVPFPTRETQADFDDELDLGGKVGIVFPLR